MSTFVLVHGAWHGGWCWNKVVPLLEGRGHTVIAPDLPSLGDDPTPVADVTLARWRDAVVNVIDAQAEPVILVGHSRGGVVISEVAQARPDNVESLVYLTAFLLQDGQSLIEVAQTDTESIIGPFFRPSADGVTMGLADEGIVPTFYHDCSAEDIAFAKARLRPEAMAGLVTAVHVTPENFGRVPRVYIECLGDRAIGPATQKKMAASAPGTRVITLETSHSPFFSAPEQLADALVSVAAPVAAWVAEPA